VFLDLTALGEGAPVDVRALSQSGWILTGQLAAYHDELCHRPLVARVGHQLLENIVLRFL
jgi:hypothetical protein